MADPMLPVLQEIRSELRESNRLLRLLVTSAGEEDSVTVCMGCGSHRVEDTGSFGKPRITCLECGTSRAEERHG